ncbi:MAG: hypothetical protein IPN29_04810 [Saprospiraceae bacterium]|nr:hypothetical protein [Saprospiraceae bacterium]
MKVSGAVLLLLMPIGALWAQTPAQVVDQFFDAMYEADAQKLKLLAIPGATLCTSKQKEKARI